MRCRECGAERSHTLLDRDGVCSVQALCGQYFDEAGKLTHVRMWRLHLSGAGQTWAAHGVDEYGELRSTTEGARARIFASREKALEHASLDPDSGAWIPEDFRREVDR